MPNVVYIAQTQQGTGSGLDAADAKAVTYFNNSANWTSTPPVAPSVLIGPGTTVHLTGTITTTLNIQGSGASGNPVTIFFEPGCVMTSSNWPLNIQGSNGFGAAIWGYAVDYIVVDGGTNGQINATGQNSTTGLVSDGVQFNYGNGIEVKNLTILNIYKRTNQQDAVSGGAGVNMYRFRNNCSVHNNVIKSAGACIGAFYDSGNYSNFSIYNNTLADANWGIGSGDIDGTSVFSNYLVYGNDITMPGTIWDDDQDDNHHNGMYIWAEHDGATITGLKIYDNYIHGDPGAHTTAFIFVGANNGGTTLSRYGQGLNGTQIFNNICVATGTNNPTNGNIDLSIDGFFVYNNTLASIDVPGFGIRNYSGAQEALGHPAGSGTIQNTIFANMATDIYAVDGVETLTADHNVDTALSTFVAGTSTSSAQNFRIISSSGARNAGVNLSSVFTVDFNGVTRPGGTTAWDVGAFQYAPVVPTFPVIVADTSTVTTLTFHGGVMIRHFPFVIADTSTVTALSFHGASAAGFTVGPTTQGSLTGTYTGIGANQITLSQPGKISSMSMFWSAAGVSYILGIYDSNQNLLASSAVGTSVVGKNTLPIANGPTLAAGTYYLGFQVQSAVGGYYDQPAGAVGLFNNGQAWTGTLPSPFPTSGTGSGQYLFSVYATFAPVVIQHFPLTVADTSTVTSLGFHGANVATFTFGKTNQGAGVASSPGIGATQYALGQAGILKSMSILSADATPNNLLMGVYADAGNVPGALLASTAVTPTSSIGWITVPIANGPTLAPGNYWLAQQAQNPFSGYYDTPVGTSINDTSVPYTGTLINPFTTGNTGGAYQVSIYATLVGPTIQNFPFTIDSTSTVTKLGFEVNRHFPFTVDSISTVTKLGFETAAAAQHFPLTIADTSTVTALWKFTIGKHFPFTIDSISTVTRLGFENGRRFPFTVDSISTVTALGLRVNRRFPITIDSISTVTALGLEVNKRFPLTIADTSSVTALTWHTTLLLHFPVQVHDASSVTALGLEIARRIALSVDSISTVTALGLEVQRAGFGFTIDSISKVTRLLWSLPVQDFPLQIDSVSTVITLGWENDHFHPPLINPPYAGANQTAKIQVPAPIAYREAEREESCWLVPPYAAIFPEVPNAQTEGIAIVPPPIQATDLWKAMQTFPL